jgi:hypothetical protein
MNAGLPSNSSRMSYLLAVFLEADPAGFLAFFAGAFLAAGFFFAEAAPVFALAAGFLALAFEPAEVVFLVVPFVAMFFSFKGQRMKNFQEYTQNNIRFARMKRQNPTKKVDFFKKSCLRASFDATIGKK